MVLCVAWTVSGVAHRMPHPGMEHLFLSSLLSVQPVYKTPQHGPGEVGSPWPWSLCADFTPTFLTHPAKQPLRGICVFLFVFLVMSTAAALPCFPTFANFRPGGLLLQVKASRAQALSLVWTDGCHVGVDLGLNCVLPSLLVKRVPNTETGP